MPRVSIITSVYNGESYLEECIESILNQTFVDFEYIILNNGSTDRTAKILNLYNDPRLRVIHQENLGISRSLNKGIDLSNSDLIARQDADDYSFLSRLEHQVKFMDQHQDIVLCGSRWLETIGGKLLKQRVSYIETDESIRKSMCLFNPFSHSVMIFRKKTFLESGGYNCQYKYSQDYDLWVRMLNFGKAHTLKEELGVARIFEGSESHKNARKQKFEGLRIRWKAFQKFGGNPRKVLCYFLKSLVGLIFPSKNYFN